MIVGMRIRALAFTLSSLGLAACGREVPAFGAKAPLDRSPISRRVDPEELMPRDLDLSVRIDLGRLRGSLGPSSRELLGSELRADPLLTKALERARVVTVGMRVSDLELGDRVIAIEGDLKGLDVDTLNFREEKMSNDRVHVYVRRDDVARDDFGAIVRLDQRALVFVSPVEVDSVKRVLGKGPDTTRPDPSANGVVSVDYRPRRLSRSLERKFPSVGRIIRELESVRGSVEVEDKGVAVDLIFTARNEAGATHVKRFIEVLRDNTVDTGLSALLRNIDVEATSSTLHVKWVLPPDVVMRALSERKGRTVVESAPDATSPGKSDAPASSDEPETPTTKTKPSSDEAQPKRSKNREPSSPPLPIPGEGLRLSPPPKLEPPQTGH